MLLPGISPSGILDLQQKGMFRWRLMKADWVKEQNGARELAGPQPLQGITKDLQVEEIMALPIPDTL